MVLHLGQADYPVTIENFQFKSEISEMQMLYIMIE